MSFWKPEACGQTVLPDRSVLIGQKLVENANIQKFKCDILSNFQTMWCIGIRSWYLALRAQHSNHYTTLYVLMSSHPTPLKVHNWIRIPKWLRNNKHPLLFVWIANWKCPLKEEDALCFSKYRCAQSWVSKSINLEGSGNSRRKTGKTRENLGVASASSFWRLWEGKKFCGKVSFGLCCIMRLFWRELHHSVWRSKDLLACNATYSIATKGQNAVFFCIWSMA